MFFLNKAVAQELFPGNFKPTQAHFFMTLLHQKGLLLRCFTQNIDSLECQAGLPSERVVAAHGDPRMFPDGRICGRTTTQWNAGAPRTDRACTYFEARRVYAMRRLAAKRDCRETLPPELSSAFIMQGTLTQRTVSSAAGR